MWAQTLNRILWVAGLLVIAYIVWIVSGAFDIFRPASYDETQIGCLAAMMRADTIGEAPEKRPKAQELVADVAKRLKETRPGLSYCDILQSAATLYPTGWRHSRLFIGRNTAAISRSMRYVGSPWRDVVHRARQYAGTPADPAGCATRIVRAEKRYSFFTGENRAAQELLRTMRRDPHADASLKTIFLCPSLS